MHITPTNKASGAVSTKQVSIQTLSVSLKVNANLVSRTLPSCKTLVTIEAHRKPQWKSLIREDFQLLNNTMIILK